MNFRQTMLSGLVFFCLLGCTHTQQALEILDGPPIGAIDVKDIPNATPKLEPKSKYGNPNFYEVFGQRYHTLKSSKNFKQKGVASWYGTKFHHQRTSSGEAYDMFAMTAAHKSLPLPTYVRVKNLENGKNIIVKVNDRGPFHENRIIDLSYVAAKKLGITGQGTGLVEIEAIDPHVPVYQTAVPETKPTIFLQLGAFSKRKNAQTLAQKIADTFHEQVHIQTLQLETSPLYKVQIGPVASIEASDKLHDSLKALGMGDALVVVD